MLLSEIFHKESESSTGYRNLNILQLYVNAKKKNKPETPETYFSKAKPFSFFVKGFDKFDEENIIKVARYLNFFMIYFDRLSPFILIHPPESKDSKPVKTLRFIEDDFPSKICSGLKDPLLLDLALAAMNVYDIRLKFIYYYQILEYAAFYYIEENTKRNMMRIICMPDIHANPEKHIADILELLSESRQEDEAKINKIVETRCDPELLWKEIEINRNIFSMRQDFDGGFAVEPYIPSDTTLETFKSIWYPKTPIILRKIRNALVHGRETRQGYFIAPTKNNNQKIRPWVSLIQRIAEQIIICDKFI
jgi:hypothetical protein